MTPPRFAERLLSASIADDEWRDSIVGDLREEFVRMIDNSAPPRRAVGTGARHSRLGAPP
jgi:hypothetical protein